MTALRWDRPRPAPGGITNGQARLLAKLCRIAGRPYPEGLDRVAASALIGELEHAQRRPRRAARST